MDARARCQLVIATLQQQLGSLGISLTQRDNRLVSEDDHSFAFLGFSPCKYSTVDRTRRYVEIAIRSNYLDAVLYQPDTYKSRYVANSCLIYTRVPPNANAWELTDEQSCINAANKIAQRTVELWPVIIEQYRTESAMLSLLARCSIDPSRQINPRRARPVDQLNLAAIGYLLHKLSMHRELDSFVQLIESKYTNTPHLHPQGTLQSCLDHITK